MNREMDDHNFNRISNMNTEHRVRKKEKDNYMN